MGSSTTQGSKVVLKPGDRFRIEGAPDPALCNVFVLDENGDAELPFLGIQSLGGMSPAEAGSHVDREIDFVFGIMGQGVRVRIVGKTANTASVEGAVRQSLHWPWRADLKLDDLLARAQPTDSADLANLQIVAADGSLALIDAGTSSVRESLLIKRGDRVIVPTFERPPIITVLGAVRNPAGFPFREGMTILDAIQAAGGPTGNADQRSIRLERDRVVVDTVNLELRYNAALRPGDVVRVPMVSNPRWVHVVGAANRPGRVDFHDGITLREAIALAGSAHANADVTKVVVSRRVGGQLRRTVLDAVGAGAGYVLAQNDVIEVPFRNPPASLTKAIGSQRADRR